MGQNLILNMNDHGYTVVAFNRTVEKVHRFLENEASGTNVIGATSIEDMVSKLKRPRRVMMLVKAGKPVDDFIGAVAATVDAIGAHSCSRPRPNLRGRHLRSAQRGGLP